MIPTDLNLRHTTPFLKQCIAPSINKSDRDYLYLTAIVLNSNHLAKSFQLVICSNTKSNYLLASI